MALTQSVQTFINQPAPDFTLPNTASGDKNLSPHLSLNDIMHGKNATVIMFTCNHCPFVKHILDKVLEVSREYMARGIAFVGICANDAEKYLMDAPDKMSELAKIKNFGFPYLYDETQNVAKAYHAACTPEFFIIDSHKMIVYHGQFDGSTPSNNIPVTGDSLCHALDDILAGKKISGEQKSSVGCNIKWK